MQKEELEKKILHLLTTTELTNEEIAAEVGCKYQKVVIVKGKLQKGMGDQIEAFTEATGIKKIVDGAAKLLNKDCGCKKRKDALNSIDIPLLRLKVVREPSEADIDEIYSLISADFKVFDRPTRERIERMRSKIFNVRYSVLSCPSCGSLMQKRLLELKRVFDAYTIQV